MIAFLTVWATLNLVPVPLKSAEFLMIPGTETLAMLGELRFADVDEFERQAEKGVTEVILSSPGGSLDAAWAIGDIITKHGINTRLTDDTKCASACSILFLHGRARYMSTGAKIGVHLPYFAGPEENVESVCGFLQSLLTQNLGPNSPRPNYKINPKAFEFNARHILVATRDEAENLIGHLRQGADFSEMARSHSIGPSGPNGGELGWFSKGMMVPSFEESAFSLNVGEFSTVPVQTEFGWHVIQLHNVRPVAGNEFGLDCLTSAYQIGALEFLRVGELISSAGGDWNLLKVIVTTSSDSMYWLDYHEALSFGILNRG